MNIHTNDRKQSILCLLATAFLVLYILLTGVLQAHAQDGTATTEPIGNPPTQSTPTKRENMRAQIQEKKEMVQENRDMRKDERASTTEARKENIKNTVQERKNTRASTTEVRKENRKARLVDAAKARIRAHAERMWKRFNAAIMRLEELARRIDSRIVKFEQSGVNLTETKRLLNLARTDIATAKTALEQAKAAVETTLAAEDPKLAFQETQNIIRTVREKIVSAHSSLVQAIRSIRASNPDTDRDATATTTENN